MYLVINSGYFILSEMNFLLKMYFIISGKFITISSLIYL